MAEDLDVEALLEAPFQKEKLNLNAPPPNSGYDNSGGFDRDGNNGFDRGGFDRGFDRDVTNGFDRREDDDRAPPKRSSDDRDDRDYKRRRRSSSRDRERERDRDRDRDRGGDRYRERERDRGGDRGDRGGDRERDRGGDRDRYRERERERERERDREKDRGYDRHSSSRGSRGSRGGSPGRDSERDDREFEREKRREREDRERRERDIPAVDREALEADRDGRTVFASNLPIKASERKLYEFFEKAGKVVDIRLISDRNSRKSKGVGYVEYAEKDSVPKSLALSGSTFMGQPIIVQVSQAEKNRVINTSSTATAISEEDLRPFFAPFGEIEFINLHSDPESGRSKGFGFVQFKRNEDAKRAMQEINGLEIAGRQIKVSLVNENAMSQSSSQGAGSNTGVSGNFGELDDDEGGGLALNAASRAQLMAKLQRPNPNGNQSFSSAPTSLIGPTSCILLKNMFDPTAETDPNFHIEIKEDVIEECSKYGHVMHAFVDKDSQGHVYLKFSNVDGAQKATNTLNHRWFAGKMITSEYIPEPVYGIRFPESKT